MLCEQRPDQRPTLLIWGDHDPVGSVEAAPAATTLISNYLSYSSRKKMSG
jgi:hypothetical protein